MSNLLNGIATKVLPKLIRSVSNDLKKYLIEPTQGDCKDDLIYPLCNALGVVMNLLRDEATKPPPQRD